MPPIACAVASVLYSNPPCLPFPQPSNPEIARAQRLKICGILKLKMNTRVVDKSKVKIVEKVADELDSYESLVRSAGY